MSAPTKIGRDELEQLLAGLDPARRRIVALAGPPASGKTTLAAQLADKINAERPGAATALGLDGFHFDDHVLIPRGDRPRKGAPHTFDVGGLRALLARLHADAEDDIAAPVFDRAIEVARAGALIIPQSVRLILLEGNYLLLDQPPWRDLRALFDVSVRLDAPEEALQSRLMTRWRTHGLSESEAARKTEENDLPNARLVIARSAPADYALRTA